MRAGGGLFADRAGARWARRIWGIRNHAAV